MTARRRSDRIGRMLVGAGLVSELQLRDALALQRRNGEKLGSALVEIGAIDEAVLGTFLGMQLGIDAVRLGGSRPLSAALRGLLAAASAWRWAALPVSRRGSIVTVVFADPNDRVAVDAVTREIGFDVRVAVAPHTSILAALRRNYPEGAEASTAEPASEPESELTRLATEVGELARRLEKVRRELANLAAIRPPAGPSKSGRRSAGR